MKKYLIENNITGELITCNSEPSFYEQLEAIRDSFTATAWPQSLEAEPVRVVRFFPFSIRFDYDYNEGAKVEIKATIDREDAFLWAFEEGSF